MDVANLARLFVKGDDVINVRDCLKNVRSSLARMGENFMSDLTGDVFTGEFLSDFKLYIGLGAKADNANTQPINIFIGFLSSANRKQSNAALERLSHATQQRSPLMASPLQARVRLRSEIGSSPIVSQLKHRTERQLRQLERLHI